MSINTYQGVPGVCFSVENPEEVYAIVDELHTQVMDNIPERKDILGALSRCMNELSDLGCLP